MHWPNRLPIRRTPAPCKSALLDGQLGTLCDDVSWPYWFLGRIDAETRSFVHAGAGHQGCLFSAKGEVRVLESRSMPLGVVDNLTASTALSTALETGDSILLPTDSVEESQGRCGRLFGRERMFDVIRNNQEKSAAQVVDALFREARHFREGESQEDDITAVIVEVLRPAQKSARSRSCRAFGPAETVAG